MSMTTQIDLTPFCAKEDTRYASSKPWVKGGFLGATDGRIAIRFPAPGEPDAVFDDDNKLPDINSVLSTRIDADLTPLPRVEPDKEMIRCLECGGTGKKQSVCEECDGAGEYECPHCGNDMTCRECDGTGHISNGDGPCPKCRGTKMEPKYSPVMLGTFKLAGHYYLMIRDLPNVRYVRDSKNEKMIHFVFDGGDGAVMGLSR